jgi:cobaltochelatase CobT
VRRDLDGAAMRARFHRSAVHAQTRPAHWPESELYDQLAGIRAMALGCLRWPGISATFRRALVTKLKGPAFDSARARFQAAVCIALWRGITNDVLPPEGEQFLDGQRNALPEDFETRLSAICNTAENESEFAQELRLFIDEFAGWLPHAVIRRPSPGSRETRRQSRLAGLFDGLAASVRRVVGNSGGREREDTLNANPQLTVAPAGEGYQVFCRRYDKIVDGRRLGTHAEREQLWPGFRDAMRPHQKLLAPLAARLERRLRSLERRYWSYDLEDGEFDNQRSARLVCTPGATNLHKRPDGTQRTGLALCVLLDCSSSMRGTPIALAGLCAGLLAQAAERANIDSELLGFTTVSRASNQALIDWNAASQHPPRPGRLNCTRHVVFKAANQKWSETRKNLSFLWKSELLQENIDGEAVLWAHSRLLSNPAARRELIVISDGAPRDRATQSAMGDHYLEAHLHEVCQTIEAKSPIGLSAIGAGHDVGRFYSRAIRISDMTELGPALFDHVFASRR